MSLNVKTLSAAQIAKKFNLSLAEVNKLIAQGAAVEKEHTKNDREAKEIARDDLSERPDYYKKLKKIEETVQEESDLNKACWKGYSAKGLKKKGNRLVPNCVKDDKKLVSEISAELVGRVSNARFRRGEAPSKTLSRAINKKYIESGKKDETPFEGSKKRSHEKSSTHVHRLAVKAMKQYQKEETTMDTKELVNEALDNILENNLVDMKENFLAALQEKAMEKLEEKRKEIASNYFAQ